MRRLLTDHRRRPGHARRAGPRRAGREGPHRAVPLARAAADVRRAFGRAAASGAHRHLRALLGRGGHASRARSTRCDESDWVFPSYRQNAIGILRGVPPSTVLAWWRGYGGELGFWNPREHRVGSDLRSDRDAPPARGRRRVGGEDQGRPRPRRLRGSATAPPRKATSTRR